MIFGVISMIHLPYNIVGQGLWHRDKSSVFCSVIVRMFGLYQLVLELVVVIEKLGQIWCGFLD